MRSGSRRTDGPKRSASAAPSAVPPILRVSAAGDALFISSGSKSGPRNCSASVSARPSENKPPNGAGASASSS